MTAVKDPDSRNSTSVASAGIAPSDGRNKVGPRPTNESDNQHDSFTRMVMQYQLAIKRMCYLYLRDVSAAEDAVQETFLKAYQHMAAFRSESKERTWLMSIAINTCRDMNRSAWFRHTEKRVTPEDLPIAAAPMDVEALALAESIRRLPGKLRDVILLYYYQDMTIQEVAEALHAAPSTILKRLRQAREALRLELDEDTPSPARERRAY